MACASPPIRKPRARPVSSGKRSAQRFEILRYRETLRGVETFNAGLVHRSSNARAALLAEGLPLARIGSSDSHLLWMIGQGFTWFQGRTANDLHAAIGRRDTTPDVSEAIRPVMLLFGWLRGYLLRRAGWVEYNRDPESPVRLKRIPALAHLLTDNK